MKKTALAFVFALVATSSSCIVVEDGDSSLRIENFSDYVLIDVAISPIDALSWGPNLLRRDVLFPGESIVVALDCDIYDVRVIDDTGVQCILFDLDLCFEDAVWEIDNFTLDRCAFGP